MKKYVTPLMETIEFTAEEVVMNLVASSDAGAITGNGSGAEVPAPQPPVVTAPQPPVVPAPQPPVVTPPSVDED